MKKPDLERIASIQKLADSGMTMREIASELQTSYESIVQCKNKYKLVIKRDCKVKDQITKLSSQHSVSELSTMLNCPEVYIRKLLSVYGLKCKPKSKRLYKVNYHGPNEVIQFNQINREYIESHSLVDSAKYFKVTPVTISRWCTRHNVVRNKRL